MLNYSTTYCRTFVKMNKICEMITDAMVVVGVVAVGLFIAENSKITIQIMWIFSAIGIAKSLLK